MSAYREVLVSVDTLPMHQSGLPSRPALASEHPDLPRYDDSSDAFVCPGCLRPLVAGDPRAAAIQLIVFLDGIEQLRVLLNDGECMRLGGATQPAAWALQPRLPSNAAKAISSTSLAFNFVDGELLVEDLGSRKALSSAIAVASTR